MVGISLFAEENGYLGSSLCVWVCVCVCVCVGVCVSVCVWVWVCVCVLNHNASEQEVGSLSLSPGNTPAVGERHALTEETSPDKESVSVPVINVF